MKKALLIAVFCLLFLSVWVLEPLSYNPFINIATPAAQSTFDFACQNETTAKNNDVQLMADNIFNKYIDSRQFLGVSVGFYKENCGTYIAGGGFSSKRDRTKANGMMLSRIASITKPMTAIAIMQLYEQGLIVLDSPIQNYLDSFPKMSEHDITIRHLLSHTSGIPSYRSKLEAMSFKNYSSLNDALDMVAERGLTNDPGAAYAYSSYGYTILGAIIEKVSGQSFEEYLDKHIWQRAGMLNTSLERNGIYPNKSRLYFKVNSMFIRSPYTDLSVIYPAGGVQSTVGDLLNFGDAILNNKLVRRDTLEAMMDVSQSLAPAAGDDPYGLGWSVYDHPEKGRIIAHSGAQPGVGSYFQILLDRGIVVATLSNAFGTKNSAYNLSKEMVDLAL